MVMPQPQPQMTPPQPLQLPSVSYRPPRTNPRTTRSIMRRSAAISTPKRLPGSGLGGSGRGAGVDRFSPLGTSPYFTGGGDQNLPGLSVGQYPSQWDQQQGLPGF